MPITYQIRPDQRLVNATAHGLLTEADIIGYQREVWSRPDVAGYDELVDMTRVSAVEPTSGARISGIANLAASMDVSVSQSKFAIVAQADVHFGLGRMYQAYREQEQRSIKGVRVFRTRGEALQWLEKPED